MKKRLFTIGVTLLCIVLFLVLIGYFRHPIALSNIDKVVLHTDIHEGGSGHADLESDDVQTLVLLYDLSRYDSYINAEPCCAEYWLEIYFKDGSMMRIGEGRKNAVIAKSVSGDRYYAWNTLLVDCIKSWIDDYHLSGE